MRKSIRRFGENGVKMLLHNGSNARDLLVLARASAIDLMDFRRMTVENTSFIQRDFRNIEADLLLKVPLRVKGKRQQLVMLYILIEHQSEPDELMPLRLLEYVAGVFRKQVRDWQELHGSWRGVRLQPVLPLVFYTGSRTWEEVGSLTALIEEGARFADVTPDLRPLFLNLGAIEAGRLEAEGGWLGQVLRGVRERQAEERAFRGVVREVVGRLEEMAAAEKERWRELMSYLEGLVYHERVGEEVPRLLKVIDTSLHSDELRREVEAMRRTMADQLMDEGKLKGQRETLLRLLGKRFGEVPPEMLATIETTDSLEQFERWLDAFVDAKTLEEVGIAPAAEMAKKRRR
jgi:predicted transposase YdaD